MRILTSSYTLDAGGMPTFTLTMYRELVKRGHHVIVYSPQGGRLAEGMNVVKSLIGVPAPDVILAQHLPCANDMYDAYPDTKMIYYSHGLVQEIEQPPAFMLDKYFAINQEVKKNLEDHGIPGDKIVIIRDFIDTEIFKPVKPIHKEIKSVLFVSNYKQWRNLRAVQGACKILGVKLKCIGATYGRSYDVAKDINDADLVVSWARGILEGMSCDRAVISWDRNEGDGYIDLKNYYQAREDNFSGRVFHFPFNAETLAKEMGKYDPITAERNRDLVLLYHNAVAGVDQILSEL